MFDATLRGRKNSDLGRLAGVGVVQQPPVGCQDLRRIPEPLKVRFLTISPNSKKPRETEAFPHRPLVLTMYVHTPVMYNMHLKCAHIRGNL